MQAWRFFYSFLHIFYIHFNVREIKHTYYSLWPFRHVFADTLHAHKPKRKPEENTVLVVNSLFVGIWRIIIALYRETFVLAFGQSNKQSIEEKKTKMFLSLK